ncbi:hypothetical protein Tco_0012713 [Tanacetum coccineum]
MPLALKTQNDSFAFVHELKQEMHANLKYVESLEKEIDELESDKAEFLNMYDMLLQECVSNDVMCSYLPSLSGLDTHAKLQCLYVHKVKECECLAQKLSKQTEFVSKEQDKNIAISELKKLIEKMKVRKLSFAKPYNVNAPGPSRNSPKHVSFQSTKESVGSNDMVHNYYLEEAKKKAQLQKDKALNTKPSVQQSARLPNTANGNKLKPRNFNQQPRNWPPFMSSRVSNKTVNTAEPPRNQKPSLKSKDLACPTCKKCIYSANHDECILQYLSKVNSCASAQKKDAQSHKTTKRYIPVEKKSESKNHGRQIPIGQRYSPNKSSNVYLKTTPLRSGLTWKPTGRIFNQVGLKWIPIKKPVETRYNSNDSTSMASEPISSQGWSSQNQRINIKMEIETPYSSRVIEQLMARSGMDLKMAKTCYHSHYWYQRHGYREQGQNLNYNHISFSSHQSPPCHYIPDQTMSSPNHSTFDIEDAFSSMNILNYTSVSSDYFPISSESSSFNSSKNTKDNMIPPVFSPFYNNPCLKDVQAFYTKESPISSPDHITPPAVLTPSPVLPPSLLFDL